MECWAEGIWNPIILMSQHKGNGDRDCITSVFVFVFYVPGCLSSFPSGNAHFSPQLHLSLPAGVRSGCSLSRKLSVHQMHHPLKAGGAGVWAPKTQLCVSCHKSLSFCGSATCQAASIGCFYI